MTEPRGRIMLVLRRLAGRAGGAERVFCDTANMFCEAGYQVTVVSCDPRGDAPVYALDPRIERVNLYSLRSRRAAGYRILDGAARIAPLPPLAWLAHHLYFTRRLYRLARTRRPDVLISFLPPANTPSLLAGSLARVKVIPTNHNVPVHDYRSTTRWDQNPVDRLLRFFALYTAARVHVLFPSFAEWFPPSLRRKVVAIPNLVSPEFLIREERPRRTEILGVGRLTDVKNYGVLVEAFARLAPRHPDWTLRLLGAGPKQRELAAQVAALGLAGRVVLAGHEDEVRRRYLEAEILAHPALHEGFGLAVAEALTCGLPVVAFSDCEGVKELVKDGENGLLVERTGGAAALAEGLERLIADHALRERLRRRAPESMRAYDLEAFRARWTQLVDEVREA